MDHAMLIPAHPTYRPSKPTRTKPYDRCTNMCVPKDQIHRDMCTHIALEEPYARNKSCSWPCALAQHLFYPDAGLLVVELALVRLVERTHHFAHLLLVRSIRAHLRDRRLYPATHCDLIGHCR